MKKTKPKTSLLKNVLSNPALLLAGFGYFHTTYGFNFHFFVLPMQLLKAQQTGALTSSWHFYLPLMLLAFLLMAPCIYYSEKKHKTKTFIHRFSFCQFGSTIFSVKYTTSLVEFLLVDADLFCRIQYSRSSFTFPYFQKMPTLLAKEPPWAFIQAVSF